jgi:hypothetical protein
MYKKIFLVLIVVGLAISFGTANAQDYTISDYDFTWRVAKAGDVRVAVQKNPSGILIILRGPGAGLGRVSMTPSQAKAVGAVLKTTEEYYNKQKKNPVGRSEDMVSAGDYRVYFSSSARGKSFQVGVKTSDAAATVLMNKDQALKMGKYLGDAEKMTALVNDHIKP